MASLGTKLRQRDAARFVGRKAESAQLERVLSREGEASVVLVHGPAGIGKSALLRQAARMASAVGFSLHWIDGRELAPVPDAIEDAVAPARQEQRPLVVLDSFERVEALGPYVREAILPSLPGDAVLLVGSRLRPDERWTEGGREEAVSELEVGPLPESEGGELLRRRGISLPAEREKLLRWSGGVPLALSMAAAASSGGEAPALDEPGMLEPLVRRLVGEGIQGPRLRTLGVAAIARVTTPAMLADVLPEQSGEEEYRWLASRTFTEPLGEGVAPHDLVGRALRATLREAEPLLERELRRRIADHLYERAVSTGALMVAIDLAHLVGNPASRWGFSWEAAGANRVDDVRPGDVATVEARLAGSHHHAVWEGSMRYFDESPEHVAVVRGPEDELRGYAVAVTPGTAPSFSYDDPILGPRLAHTRSLDPVAETVLWRESVDFTRDPAAGVIGLLGMAMVLRSVRSNPRYGYLPINPRLPGAREFAAAIGARHLPDLDARVGDELLECFLIDWGPGGLVAAQRELVYRELGIEPPRRPDQPPAVQLDAVRWALRNLDVPGELSRSELAEGASVTERAASVRAQLAEAAERAFGGDPAEALTRRVLERGYLDPAPSHEAAAAELNISRSAYFRRLRQASERVADYLSAR